jgi:Ni/Co efflux regulator RcnB
MKKLYSGLAVSILSASLMGTVGLAQDDHRDDHHDSRADDHHDNHGYVEHKDWKKGAPIRHEDWDRGNKVDYHQYHLSPPPRGYEWRMVDGQYVLANSSNFQIRAVIHIP